MTQDRPAQGHTALLGPHVDGAGVADQAPELCPHALRQHLIAHLLACETGPQLRPQADGAVGEVARGHIDGVVEAMAQANQLIACHGAPTPAHLWIIEIHQASAHAGANHHRESFLHG